MMTKTLMIVAETGVITWVMLIAASLIRARAWTVSGMRVALGNREGVQDPEGFAARTDRTAKNMLENYILFAAIALVASVAGIADPWVELGARLFFWARVAYIPIYMAGIPVARTAAWAVSIIGMGMILTAIVQALPPGL